MDGQRGTDSVYVVHVPVGFWASPRAVHTLMIKTVPSWMETAAWTSVIPAFSKKLISSLSSFESKDECISLYC